MSRRNLRVITVGLTFAAGCALLAAASQEQTQQQAPPPPPAAAPTAPSQPAAERPYQQENPEQLQQLVAPIALYPDPLVASVLAASSYPSGIAQAYDWLAPRRNLSPQEIAVEADKQNWDPSVKSLLAFPPVLQNLATNLSWTSELGDAYYNQPTDVTNAIQEMRRQAKKHGILKSNDQVKVQDKHGYITIEPKNPDSQVVYVPSYDPWIAYGYPITPWPGWVAVPGAWYDGPGLYFGEGFGLAPFWGFGWGWPVWGFDWWGGGIWYGGGHYWHRGWDHWDRAATIAASPVLVIAVVRTSALVAASRDARQAWGRDPLAASAMAPKAGASPLAAKRVSAAFMGVAFMEADSVAAASMVAEVADGAKPRGSPHAGQFPIVFGQMLAPQGS